ncbi:MAG: ArsR/SmtB family transcription factor [Candidatus Baltobacteraceae bacterium]
MAKRQAHDAALERGLRALANDRRLQILDWLKNPRAHFPRQTDGDLVDDGVCGLFIADKLGVSQPTVSEHLRVLTAAGLLRGKRIKQWTFYKRDEKRIAEIKRLIERAI